MDPGVDYERLDLPEIVTAAATSLPSMLLATILAAAGLTGDGTSVWADLGPLLLILLMYAGPIWLVGFLVVGIPAAVWIENRTPMQSSWGRRYAPYAVAGLVAGGLLFLLHPLFLPATLGAALGGRLGVALWRRWDRRHETTPWPPLPRA